MAPICPKTKSYKIYFRVYSTWDIELWFHYKNVLECWLFLLVESAIFENYPFWRAFEIYLDNSNSNSSISLDICKYELAHNNVKYVRSNINNGIKKNQSGGKTKFNMLIFSHSSLGNVKKGTVEFSCIILDYIYSPVLDFPTFFLCSWN